MRPTACTVTPQPVCAYRACGLFHVARRSVAGLWLSGAQEGHLPAEIRDEIFQPRDLFKETLSVYDVEGSTSPDLRVVNNSSRRLSWTLILLDISACCSGVLTARSAGAAATIRSTWRESSSEASATGTRRWVIRLTTSPTSKNQYIAVPAASTANALIQKNAKRRRPRTPKRSSMATPPQFGRTPDNALSDNF